MVSAAMPVIIMCWSMSIMSRSVSMVIVSSTMSTHFMELDTIAGVFFFLIESNIGEIVPDREYSCGDNIGEEDLVEHKEYPEWENNILTSDDKGIKHGSLYRARIEHSIAKKIKYRSRLEYICLICHVYHRCEHRYDKKYRREKVEYRIDGRMCWFCDNKSSMHRKEHCEDIDKIYSNTHDKY